MDGFEDLRGTQQQLKDEFAADYKRLTDPEERKKEKLKRMRKEVIQSITEDAGL